MDARSIAATAANGGVITAATDVEYEDNHKPYSFDGTIYSKRIYNGFGHALPETELRYGPNIKDWPAMPAMQENMMLELAAVIHDPVTTTDELIPSGETSSYRSNPLKLSEFALSRRVPEYVGLYFYSTEWDNYTMRNKITYGVIDTASLTKISDNFITDGTDSEFAIPYGIAIHPETGEIFVTDASNYVSSGTLYCFSPSGTLEWKVRTGDIPAHIAFLHK